MTDKQKQFLQPILDTIQADDIREFAIQLVDDFPPYIWEVGASSTGKYHPQYALGEGGLMRHMVAATKFLNYILNLEMTDEDFTPREKDLLRVAVLIHDGRKSGEKKDYEVNKYTKFEHSILQADAVRKLKGGKIPDDEIEFVATAIESHMGQFNTDKKSGQELPKPQTKAQKIVHLADYLASRKDIEVLFDVPLESEKPVPTPETYIFPFGKHKGEKLSDVAKTDPDYIEWGKKNFEKEPLKSLIAQI